MKKIILSTLFVILGMAASAQMNKLMDNTFLSFDAGINTYANDNAGMFDNVSFAGQVSVGKWILNSVAIRANLGVAQATVPYSISQASAMYFNGHCDFVWDPVTTFSGVNPRQSFYFLPFIGWGFAHRGVVNDQYVAALDVLSTGPNPNSYDNTHGEHDFLGLAGFDLEFKINKQLSAFGEFKMFILPEHFDLNTSMSTMTFASVGMKYNYKKNPYRRRKSGESRNPDEDWFIGACANVTSFQAKNMDMSRLKMLSGDGGITIGKYFTSKVAIRLQASFGGASVGEDKNFSFYEVHSDILLNASNLDRTVRGRKTNVTPYAGAGLIQGLAEGAKATFCADAGLVVRFYINKQSDFYIDGRYTVIPPTLLSSVDCWPGGQTSLSCGLITIGVGYQYNLGYGNVR